MTIPTIEGKGKRKYKIFRNRKFTSETLILSYEPKGKLIFVEEVSKIDLEICKQYASAHNLKTIKSILGW